jgi:hypothetical protein
VRAFFAEQLQDGLALVGVDAMLARVERSLALRPRPCKQAVVAISLQLV